MPISAAQAIRFRRAGSTPPADAIERVMRFRNFHLHLAAPWLSARTEERKIVARAAGEDFRFDFAIAGTGDLDQYGIAARTRAVNFDEAGKHCEDHVGGRAHGKQLCALGIAYEHVPLE